MPPRFRFQLRSVTLLLGATLVVAGCASGSAARAPGAQPSHQAAPAPAGALRLRMAGFAGGPDYVLPDDLAVSRTPSYVLGLLMVGAVVSVASYSTGLR